MCLPQLLFQFWSLRQGGSLTDLELINLVRVADKELQGPPVSFYVCSAGVTGTYCQAWILDSDLLILTSSGLQKYERYIYIISHPVSGILFQLHENKI